MHLTLPPLVLVDMAAKQPSAYLVFDAEREGLRYYFSIFSSPLYLLNTANNKLYDGILG
jgi:hypothetical protein